MYPNPIGSFTDSTGSVIPFVRWIEDYPLPDGLKMPSHIGSYDGKGDPDNFLHLFEGAIHMQKWLMPIACHMFTYTLKDSARICRQNKFTKTHLAVHNIKQRKGESTRAFITRYTDDTLQILGLHEEQRISSFVHGLWMRNLVEHLSTYLPCTYKGLMEKTYTWIEAREVATNRTPNDRRENFKRSRKSFWDNNRGQKGRDRFSLYQGPNHGLLSNLSKSPREILVTEKVARSFEQPPRMFRSKRSWDISKYCHLHEDHGYDTNKCHQLRIQIEEAMKSGQLSHLVKGIKKERDKSYTKNKFVDLTSESKEITFPSGGSNSSTPVVIKAKDNNAEDGNHGFHHSWAIKFYTTRGFGTVFSTHESDKIKEGMKKVRETPLVNEKGVFSCTTAEEKVVVNNKYLEQTVVIGKQLPEHFKGRIQDLLRANADVFTWTHANMIVSVTLDHFTSLSCCSNTSRKEKEIRRSLERETRERKMVELLARKMFTNEPTPFSLMENGIYTLHNYMGRMGFYLGRARD
ncbi:hypothetical protein Tco_1455179 [Tanacetum coccineum]